jgi:hypothetical protein
MATKKVSPLDAAGAKAPADNLTAKEIADLDMRKADHQEKVNKGIVERQPKVSVSMSPMYAPYFGEVMTVTLNGMSIYFPVDGRTYEVPEAFARIIHKRRRMVDSQQNVQAKLGDLTNNKDSFAGELILIPR